jgi:hypothetical protein
MFSGSGHDRGSGAHGQIDTPQAAGFEGNPVSLRDLSFLRQANLRRSFYGSSKSSNRPWSEMWNFSGSESRGAVHFLFQSRSIQ